MMIMVRTCIVPCTPTAKKIFRAKRSGNSKNTAIPNIHMVTVTSILMEMKLMTTTELPTTATSMFTVEV